MAKYKGLKSSVRGKGRTRSSNPYSKSKGQYKGIESTAATRKQRVRPRSATKQRYVRILPLKGGNLVEQLPETALTKRGMTLKQLLANTPKLMRVNGEETTVKKLKRTKTKSLRPAVTAVCRHNDPFRPQGVPRDHETQVVGRDPDLKLTDRKQKVLVSCDCVTGDTQVLTTRGWKKICDIAEPLEEGRYDINYIIDGKKYAGSAPFYKGKSPVYKIETSNGVELKATKDHKVLVKRGDKPEWLTVSDIEIGDNLVLSNPKLPNLPEKTYEFNIMKFLGFMQGDGTSNVEGKSLDLQIYNEDKLPILDLFSKMGIVEDVKDSARNGQRVIFNHRALEFTSRYGYDNIHAVKWKHREHFYGYLSGLVIADGSVSTKDGKILSLQIRGSDKYLRPVFDQLHRYGYTTTSIRLERKSGTKVKSKSMTVESKSDLYCLTLSAKTFYHLRDYLELTGRFYEAEFKEFADRLPLTKVKSKVYAGRQHVYDITVPGPTRFVVDGSIVVHNCENYLYYWEYANAHNGAGKLVFGNGERPDFTNPGLSPGLCKHLVALVKKIIEKGY